MHPAYSDRSSHVLADARASELSGLSTLISSPLKNWMRYQRNSVSSNWTFNDVNKLAISIVYLTSLSVVENFVCGVSKMFKITINNNTLFLIAHHLPLFLPLLSLLSGIHHPVK